MSTITLPNTFVAGTNAVAADVNENFTAVTAVVNGDLDNTNIASEAAIDEDKIAMDIAAGHDHDGADSKLLPAASITMVVPNTTQGGIKALRGITSAIADGANESVDISSLSLSDVNQVLSVDVRITDVEGINHVSHNYYDSLDVGTIHINKATYSLTTTTLTIINSTGNTRYFAYSLIYADA
jgi:imidazole glycerol phosphate synthase subunit HisF